MLGGKVDVNLFKAEDHRRGFLSGTAHLERIAHLQSTLVFKRRESTNVALIT